LIAGNNGSFIYKTGAQLSAMQDGGDVKGTPPVP